MTMAGHLRVFTCKRCGGEGTFRTAIPVLHWFATFTHADPRYCRWVVEQHVKTQEAAKDPDLAEVT